MERQELKALEGPFVEFKRQLDDPLALARTLIAFANGRGGRIIVGVDDRTREPVGIPSDDVPSLEEWVTSVAYDRCEPLIVPVVRTEWCEGHLLLVIHVYPGPEKPYHLKGRPPSESTYIRVGSTSRLADRETIRQLERESRNIGFDETPVYDATPDDLDTGLIKEYLRSRHQHRGTPPEDVTPELLRKLRATVSEQGRVYPTVAGILLFTTQPDRFLPNARIRCARFKGTTTDEFIDQQEITGPLWEQVDQALKFVRRNIRLSGRIEGVRRVDRYEYPLDAVREAVVNAVVHRDYSISGQDIRLAIFDDCIEITSPGLLPTGISVEELGTGASEVRNRVIARTLKDMGLIEEWGRGTRIMKEAMAAWGLPPPRFEEKGRDFQVTLIGPGPGGVGAIPPDVAARLTPRQQEILHLALARGGVTAGDVQSAFGLSRAAAYLHLRGLVDKGLLQPVGTRRWRRYVPVTWPSRRSR
ncbi:AlbA family DNA-binding domain-containing protein [Caldinitratiruptor microaerophilus]|uniref:Schlafen AlbA-2 domain-containing protein n=1 Tax=Caldinitratiruptor microaerophilus TaxID=671077 RepID=A0AA35G8E9_9FIRM|nr:helix-turn-helix domain-containing protein [Caldinitratiruptor microaerophilus]BDG60950.1 hypothetical protein caldi_20400 [Caldinitratiruptor microaerophilus]